MSLKRLPLGLFPVSAALLAAVIGCSHPLEIDVPANYSGKVTVLCTRFSEDGRPIQADANGMAHDAVCPRSRHTLVVVRDGKAIKPANDPQWSTTGDGIVLGIEFDVP